MNSIGNRLTVYVLAGTLVMLVLVACVLDHLVRGVLMDEFDRGLLVRADILTTITEIDNGIVEFEYEPDFLPTFSEDANDPEYFSISLRSGRLLANSESLEEEGTQAIRPAYFSDVTPGVEPVFASIVLPDGRPGRVVEFVFTPRIENDSPEENVNQETTSQPEDEYQIVLDLNDPNAGQMKLTVARGTNQLADLIAKVRLTLGGSFAALMLGMIFLVQWSIKRGLKPMRQLAAEVSSLDEGNLNRRVSTPYRASELEPMSEQLNNVLEQLESAFARERSFSGNVAHELRTPIAELRSFAEVGKKWPNDPELVEKFFGELIGLADDMERTVVNLLMLSRVDSGNIQTNIERVNLADLVDRLSQRHAIRAEESSIKLHKKIPDGLRVSSDPDKLSLIISNLLSNAISHSPTGSEVTVELKQSDAGIDLIVRNVTDELVQADMPNLFQRFWRKDDARTSGRHVGLGLSIVKSLCDVLELRVEPRMVRDRHFEVALGGLALA